LSSIAGNDWPTISYLQEELWEDSLDKSLLLPANLLSFSGLTQYGAIATEIALKEGAGFDTTIIDPWGRLLSYQLLEGHHGGVRKYMSSLATYNNFTNFNVPFPIITAIGVVSSENQCTPPDNATQYEFSPFEFGSWDAGVSAFTPVKYIGSNLTNGQPDEAGKCIEHYDNLGYVLGTSSDIFPAICEVLTPASGANDSLANVLEGIISLVHEPVFEDLFGLYRNPFYNYNRSSRVAADTELTLLDGGFSDQVNPIWPFIVDERDVDVLIVNDNTADTANNFPNGSSIHQTYLQAQIAGLSKMPFVPDPDTFVAEGLNTRATFFGCDEKNTTLMVFLPNKEYSFDSGTPTAKIVYSKEETRGMIANGVQVGDQDGEEGWGLCLACAIKIREEGLPEGCEACFEKYCYRQGTGNATTTRV
jgi:lysophospholipase